MQWLAVAIGGALGAMGRLGLTEWLFPVFGARFPLGTLMANWLGCFLAGIVFVLIVDKGVLPPEYRPFLITGFMGALTTFSTFSLDALLLWQNGSPVTAVAYSLLTLAGCLIAVSTSVFLTRLML
ncbi:fluoride efflux transporter CrcB [Marinimicrobium sp. ARAG 43.8]|uniref:fluoride efflux transporter CrcB n=1 Tax=Marinimicrobium sp. ARAG 43.8 TaxID=3418719 RepID=UPI003CEFDB4C